MPSGAIQATRVASTFGFNDDALVPGSAFWVELVEQQLGEGED